MAGYIANARLQGGVPRFVGGGADRPVAPWTAAGTASRVESGLDPSIRVDRFELVGRPVDEAIADWLASLGEGWSQLTFFLFDPDSWR